MDKQNKLREFRKNMFPNITSKLDRARIVDQEKPVINSVKSKTKEKFSSQKPITVRDSLGKVVEKRLRHSDTITPFPVREALAIRISDSKISIRNTHKDKEKEEQEKEAEEKRREKEAQEKAIQEEARKRTQGGI